MRKRMIILAALLFLTTIGSAVVIGKYRSLERNVVLTEVTDKGETDAAKGLVVSFYEYPEVFLDEEYKHMTDYQWEHAVRFDAGGIDVTTRMIDGWDLRKMQKEYEEREETLSNRMGVCIWGFKTNDIDHLRYVLPENVRKSIEETESGTVIRLSDYLEFYPMIWEIDLPSSNDGASYVFGKTYPYKDSGNEIRHISFYESLKNEREYGGEIEVDHSATMEVARKIQEFFRIPMLSTEQREFVRMIDDLDDVQYIRLSAMIMTSVGEDLFEPVFKGILTDEALYFTFDPHTNSGAVVDTSLIPGGYGIYVLPYRQDFDTRITTALVDELRLFVPLDTAMSVEEIKVSYDQKTLLVQYRLDEQYHIRLIDIESGTTLYDEAICGTEDIRRLNIGSDEDFFVINGVCNYPENNEFSYDESLRFQSENSRLMVLGKNADGRYEMLMNGKGYLQYSAEHMAYDGGRLAVVFPTYEQIYVMVYSEDGLKYQGRISSSLGQALDESENQGHGFLKMWNLQCRWE